MTKRHKPVLPGVCAAVKSIREAYGDTQERFAHRVNLAPMTVSRFERGKQIPTDFDVLARLAEAARDKGLVQEANQLDEARRSKWATLSVPVPSDKSSTLSVPVPSDKWSFSSVHLFRATHPTYIPGFQLVPAFSLPQWRLMSAARIAALYYPEVASAIEKAAGQALALVDEAIRQADSQNLTGSALYEEIERRLRSLAEQRALEQFKKERDQ